MGAHDKTVSLPTSDVERALIDAAGSLMARWGVAKTTAADLAREAGCSRATLYRVFPGGKSQIMALYGLGELQGFFDEACARAQSCERIDDALVAVITAATQGLADHAGFQFMLSHEPGLVLPYLGFSQIDRLYRIVADALSPTFEPFVGDQATALVEMATRITLSHVFQPSPEIDMTNPDHVRRIVEGHLTPTVSLVLAVPA